MKKLKYVIIVIISLFIYTNSVQAAAANIVINPSAVRAGDNFTITATVPGIAAWNVELKATGPVSAGCSKKFASETEDALNIDKVFTLSCSATADGVVTVSIYGDATTQDNVTSEVSASKTVNVHTPSSDTTLKTLMVNGVTVNSGERIEVNAESANVSATAASPARITAGVGNVNLKYGDNPVNIIVTAESGLTKTYTITIYRPDNRSNNANLKDLKVSKGSLKFNKNTTSYNVEVDTDTDEITITGYAEDGKATVSGNGTKQLKLGNNNVYKIVVKAENGATKEYSIRVNRKDNRSKNNNLKSLTASTGDIDFKADKTEYEMVVDYEVEKISFKAQTEDKKSRIDGLEERSLEVGTNILNVRVTAENGNVKTYKITVIRNKEVVETVNNKAKSIIIKDHDLNFDPDKTDYTLETRLHELDINVEADPSSKVEITGNEDLHDGSIVQITITDKDGNNNIYTIKIYNPNESKDEGSIFDLPIFKTPKYILYIVILVSIIIVLILLILVSQEKANIKKMLKKSEHHHNHDEESYSQIDNSGLTGEPSYETLEMAKIELEDYLSEESKARRKRGMTESEENIKTIRTELEEKIAILEEAENTLDEMKKNKETFAEIDKQEVLEDAEITIDDNNEIVLEEIKLDEIDTKPKQTRSAKRASKKIDIIDIDGFVSEPEMKDDIDDIINASKDVDNIETDDNQVNRTSKNKKKNNKSVEKVMEEIKEELKEESKVEAKEEQKKENSSNQNSNSENGTTAKKKKKKKKKKSNTNKSQKVANDELLDQILSKNYDGKKGK